MTESELDAILHALAHVHRRNILDIVSASPGITVGSVAKHFDVSRIAVMNHLAVLERAGLLLSEREGTSRHLYLNAAPLEAIVDRWTTRFGRHWSAHLLDIKQVAESAALGNGKQGNE